MNPDSESDATSENEDELTDLRTIKVEANKNPKTIVQPKLGPTTVKVDIDLYYVG